VFFFLPNGHEPFIIKQKHTKGPNQIDQDPNQNNKNKKSKNLKSSK